MEIAMLIKQPKADLKHNEIGNEINSYEQSLDPEICEVLVEKIDLFNAECSPYVEILDCS